MNFHKFSKNIIFIILFMLINHIMADDNSTSGYHGVERDALLSLKGKLEGSFLDKNWTGLMCYLNDTPRWYGIRCLNGRVTGIELETLGLVGIIKVDALVNLTELSIINFKNNSLSGNLMDFSNNRKLTKIDFSSNNFDGEIPNSLLKLNNLQSLQLQENILTGSIPSFNQSTLTVFNVSYNKISGKIPNTTTLQSFDYSSYIGNENLCGLPFPKPCFTSNKNNTTSNSDNKKSSPLTAIIIVVNVVVLITLLFLALIYYKKYKKLKNKNLVQTTKEIIKKGDNEEIIKGKLIFINNGNNDEYSRLFEIDDLFKASAESLGKGNFGNCYKAVMVNNNGSTSVVVKRLKNLKALSRDEFVKTVMEIADLKHVNLFPFLAYYYSSEEKLLVMKFAANGNLYNRIHGGRGTKDRIPFQWRSRLSTAISVARALEYLHLNPKTPTIVPHGNLKSSNVLFDENDVVLVSDYSLSSLISPHIASQRMVSFQSPEFKASKRVSRKSDVYSYGCLLLELLTGKLPSHDEGSRGVDLCNWIHRAVREEWTAEIFDMEIAAQRSANEGMVSLMQIAMRCCEKSPEKRPEMSEIVREVENLKVTVDSENEDYSSLDQSLTDDSISTIS